MVAGIIIAGGVGERFESPIPKQFVEVLGKPMIVYTMERFNESPDIDVFDVVTLPDFIEVVYEWAKKHRIAKLRKVIPSGSSFGESMRNGVYSFEGYCTENDIFVMHMAIAPLVPDAVISDLVNVCKEHGNAFSAVPSYLCMCEETGNGYSNKYLERESIYGLNMPHAVRYGKVLQMYRRAESEGYDLRARTHLSTMFFDMKEKVHFSKSSPINIKITTREDMELFEAYLLLQKNRSKNK